MIVQLFVYKIWKFITMLVLVASDVSSESVREKGESCQFLVSFRWTVWQQVCMMIAQVMSSCTLDMMAEMTENFMLTAV